VSTSKPVVVYGASGYTGRLVCEYLREYNIPFVAAGRDAGRVQEVMDKHVPGIETADYEVAAVEHTTEALTELFTGAQVVCNMVGPFADLGHETVQAALNAGCHYTDTTGEQNWILAAEERYAAQFAEQDLLLAPGIAHMYSVGEIAANVALETPGLDTLDILVLWKGFPTFASTQTIFTNLMSTPYYLEQNQYVEWPGGKSYDVIVPGQHATNLTVPWGGTSHPVWFRRDPRVANVRALGGVFDRGIMENVAGLVQMYEEQLKPLPEDQQREKLQEIAATMQAGMPPRENPRLNVSVDSVYASGPLGGVHCVIRGNSNYKQTGLLQAFAAFHLVHGTPLRTGFASACQAFGHRELLAVLQRFGLSGAPQLVGDVAPVPVRTDARTYGSL
jgi:short subunit dehydrogenase-like uncharacterized protein